MENKNIDVIDVCIKFQIMFVFDSTSCRIFYSKRLNGIDNEFV